MTFEHYRKNGEYGERHHDLPEESSWVEDHIVESARSLALQTDPYNAVKRVAREYNLNQAQTNKLPDLVVNR